MEESTPTKDEETPLFYESHNPTAQTSIVLIHGAFCSGKYWDLVVPHLQPSYHLLIPDLPGHGQSRDIPSFSIESSADHIAQLIRKEAVNGSAHVIGHSLGAHVAIKLACKYPDLVKDVFVSGFAVFPPSAMTPYLPYVVWPIMTLENLMPRSVLSWLMDGTDVPRLDTSIATTDLCRRIVGPLTTTQWPTAWPARTLVVAAAKGGVIPSADSVTDAARLAEIGRELNKETVGFVHPDMRHPWNRQAPELFADTVCAWFEGRELPEGFTKL